MKKVLTVLMLAVVLPASLWAQFDGAAETEGSKAIKYDDPRFVEWAIDCEVTRGLRDIAIPTSGRASFGSENMAIGPITEANPNDATNCISLGDAGYAVMSFQNPIYDGEGYDFAVFENALNDGFLELALVYVSSDGENYFTFPSTSNTPTNVQTSSFGNTDPTLINNIAGKYRIGWGTPFDISEIDDDPNLDKNNIRFVKIVDVVGTIDPQYATRDSHGNIINDPYPTNFESCGFDLSGVGVINSRGNISNIENPGLFEVSVFPNPCTERLYIKANNNRISLYNMFGQKLYEEQATDGFYSLDMTKYPMGVYVVEIQSNGSKRSVKVIKK